jgi:hypothetical protein
MKQIILSATILFLSIAGFSQTTQDVIYKNSFTVAPAALPVSFNFTAVLNKSKIDLRWMTASEKNVSHFELERSFDGINYTAAGIVFAYGNTNENKTYTFPENVNMNKVVIYYRLRSIDGEGKSQLSEIRINRTGKENEVTSTFTYPNASGTDLAKAF